MTDTMAESGELQMQVIRANSHAHVRCQICANVQERKVGKRGGEENVGYAASEGEEVAQAGYGSIQV